MQLNIKNGEAYRLAKQIADRTGESLTDVVTNALRDRSKRERGEGSPGETKVERLKRLRDIAARFDTLPVLDEREPDDILGYDESGLPT